jgi:hypothetical protein
MAVNPFVSPLGSEWKLEETTIFSSVTDASGVVPPPPPPPPHADSARHKTNRYKYFIKYPPSSLISSDPLKDNGVHVKK